MSPPDLPVRYHGPSEPVTARRTTREPTTNARTAIVPPDPALPRRPVADRPGPGRRGAAPQVPARARRRRRRRRAALRRRLRWPAARAEATGLAPLPGGDRRPRHLLRPALRARPRDARRLRGDPDPRRGRRRRHPRRGPPLRQALLDQLGPVQQPDVAQVRARMFSRSVRRCREGRRGRRRRVPEAARRVARRDARPPPADVLRPRLRADRHQQVPRPRRRHPGRQRQQLVQGRDHWRTSTASRSATGSTPDW